MKTPKEIADEILDAQPGLAAFSHEERDRLHIRIVRAIEAVGRARLAGVKPIVFVGPYEEFASLDQAKERAEELSNSGHAEVVVANVQAEDASLKNALTLTIRKVWDTGQAGVI